MSGSEKQTFPLTIPKSTQSAPWSPPVSPLALPFLRIGQNVLIESGPLAGIRGVVLRDENAWRVVVSVEALDRSIAVEVDREILQTWPSTNPEIAR